MGVRDDGGRIAVPPEFRAELEAIFAPATAPLTGLHLPTLTLSPDWLRAIMTVVDWYDPMTPACVKDRLIWFLPEQLAGHRLRDRQVRARVAHLREILDRGAHAGKLLRLHGRPWTDAAGHQVRGSWADQALNVFMYWIVTQLKLALRGNRKPSIPKRPRHSRRARTRPEKHAAQRARHPERRQ